ncbi:hypothetical protein GCM10009564_23970 [Streptomyces thermogriseus]|uniref:Uncharacterized protein n=1 Tax=Streptomyces thermogriseus TaxID=75292 RepID=A0ABN1SY87_9ACTN
MRSGAGRFPVTATTISVRGEYVFRKAFRQMKSLRDPRAEKFRKPEEAEEAESRDSAICDRSPARA